jgi:hypothetical protein
VFVEGTKECEYERSSCHASSARYIDESRRRGTGSYGGSSWVYVEVKERGGQLFMAQLKGEGTP